MSVSLNKPGSLGQNQTAEAYQVQSQINRTPGVTKIGTKVPRMGNGDFSMTVGSERFSLWLGADKGTRYQLDIPRSISDYRYIEYQEGATPPTTGDFPDTGDWGWYKDTAATAIYLTMNQSGTLLNISLQTLAGTLTPTQHGNLASTAASTMHSFNQLSGSLTTAQHGNFAAAATNDSLHAEATTARYGFLSPTNYSLLAGATSGPTADTLAKRGAAGALTATSYRDGNLDQVIGTRITWSGTPTGTLSRAAFTTFASTYTDGITTTMVAALNVLSAGLGDQIKLMSEAAQDTQDELEINSRRLGAHITDAMVHGYIHV